MVMILWLLILLAILWLWLAGHWFGRVLVLPIFALTLGAATFLLFASSSTFDNYRAGIDLCFPVALLSWPLASLPIYYRRRLLSRR